MQLAASYSPPPSYTPRIRDDHHRELIQLRSENEELRAERDYLKELLEPKRFLLPNGDHFKPTEARIATRLLLAPANCAVTGEQLLSALYHDGEERSPNMVHVTILTLRRKLAPYGIKISTLWGQGFVMDVRSRAALRALLAPADGAQA